MKDYKYNEAHRKSAAGINSLEVFFCMCAKRHKGLVIARKKDFIWLKGLLFSLLGKV